MTSNPGAAPPILLDFRSASKYGNRPELSTFT